MTVWSIALELLNKYEEERRKSISECTKGKRKLLKELDAEVDAYKQRLEAAYRKESEQAEKIRNEELDYFCGRHTFFPYEC